MFTEDDVRKHMPGKTDVRQVLLALTQEGDQQVLDANAHLAQICDTIKDQRIASVLGLKGKPASLYKIYYALPEEHRDLIKRVSNWPRAWVTVFHLLDVSAWKALAKLTTGKSQFDAIGGGVWLSKYDAHWYERVINATRWYWGNPVGTDGHTYLSWAEAILASLFHFNIDKLSFTYSPRHTFNGPGSKAPRPCLGDLLVEVKTGVPCKYKTFVLENWARLDNPENRASTESFVQQVLQRREHKLTKIKEHAIPLVQTESQVFRDQGTDAFILHVRDAVKEQAGLELDINGFIPPRGGAERDLALSDQKIALILKAHDCKTVNEGKKHPSHRIRSICSEVVMARHTQNIEVELAELWGRMPRTRKTWGSSATLEQVRMHVRRSNLNKTTYAEHYGAGLLPLGFPNSPSQQWPEWSWPGVLAGFHRGQEITDFEHAQRVIQKWQRRTGAKLECQSDYERAYARSNFLKRLPKQPDNLHSGGLKGWPKVFGWDQFLESDYQKKKNALKELEAHLLKTTHGMDAALTAQTLLANGYTNARLYKNSNAMYKKLKERPDWPIVSKRLLGKQPLEKQAEKIVEILLSEQVLTEPDFIRLRPHNSELQRIPKHIERVAKGLFMKARQLHAQRSK